ncbi:N-acetylmuramic acid 6-phosphate etherase [Scandinavium sp.]|uniref:N-acetylmuramic acid 6-phosphate etherase n=1 Tax=Scandinavium sp. TaxID=2830653 RepID=UPI00289C7D83|nr:N-acetylmuramic acid 6-phosphate etherase [Scandinavium sp.]
MSIKPMSSAMERRNAETTGIDKLSTHDMLAMINREDRLVTDAIAACLPEITRLVDNATATLSRGGRVILAGAGASGRAAVLAAGEFAPDNKHSLLALMAGGLQSMVQTSELAAADYDRGVKDLEAIAFSNNDMLIGLSISGKTPWVWGALRHAWSLGARVAIVTQDASSEAAQLADIAVVPPTGPEVVAGYNNPKAQLAQKQILTMLTTGIAIRSGRVYSNLRVDVQGNTTRWQERQIALVMELTGCPRAQAKVALANGNNHCRTAILSIMTGLDAWRSRELLSDNNDNLRLALMEAQEKQLHNA